MFSVERSLQRKFSKICIFGTTGFFFRVITLRLRFQLRIEFRFRGKRVPCVYRKRILSFSSLADDFVNV